MSLLSRIWSDDVWNVLGLGFVQEKWHGGIPSADLDRFWGEKRCDYFFMAFIFMDDMKLLSLETKTQLSGY